MADTYNNKIRKITIDGEVTTIAGTTQGYADGFSAFSQFNRPKGIAIDTQGNLYICDAMNQRIRKVNTYGIVVTFSGSTQGCENGTALDALFNFPRDIAIDSENNLYIADRANHKIRKISQE